jgi:hypothetical protein
LSPALGPLVAATGGGDRRAKPMITTIVSIIVVKMTGDATSALLVFAVGVILDAAFHRNIDE